MLSSFLPLIVLVSSLIVIWPLSWWGVKLTRAWLHHSTALVGQAGRSKYFSSIWAGFSSRLPRTSQFLEARFTTSQFSGLLLTLILVVMIYLLSMFGGMVEELIEAEELIQIDNAINQQLDLIRTDIMLSLFAWITDLGGAPALSAVAVVSTGLLWAHSQLSFIVPLWLTVLGSQLMTYSGKYLLQRQRPEAVIDLVEFTPSFPSGHATSAFAVYGFMAYVISRGLTSTRQQFELIYWTTVLIILIGFSRMILGVHYASDVAAGFLVGSFWLLMGIAVAELIHSKR